MKRVRSLHTRLQRGVYRHRLQNEANISFYKRYIYIYIKKTMENRSYPQTAADLHKTYQPFHSV